MRQRIIDQLTRDVGDSAALDPVRREQFLVYVMGLYRTFDVGELLPDDAEVDTEVPSFATWDSTTGEYSEDEVLRLLQETRECLWERGFNAYLAIDVGIPLDEMDAATQSIEFARSSNAVISSPLKLAITSASASKSGAFSKISYRAKRWIDRLPMQSLHSEPAE